jgi:hypothetical protein
MEVKVVFLEITVFKAMVAHPGANERKGRLCGFPENLPKLTRQEEVTFSGVCKRLHQ